MLHVPGAWQLRAYGQRFPVVRLETSERMHRPIWTRADSPGVKRACEASVGGEGPHDEADQLGDELAADNRHHGE